jgi:hypothetical protein
MQKSFAPLACLFLLLTVTARADDLPFFSALRGEIVNQLTIASNTLPLDKKLVAALNTNLKLIGRTKATLVNGSAALGVLAKNLGRTSLSNTFLPILADARTAYADALDAETDALESRLADTIPGKAQAAAQVALNKLQAAIDDSRTNASFTLALKSLSKAAKAVAAAQKAVTKAESAPPGAGFLSATITESNQGVTTFQPARSELANAAEYDPFSGEFDIIVSDGRNLGGGQLQGRVLTFIANLPGAGSYTLNLTNVADSFAIYERVVGRNVNSGNPDIDFYEQYATVNQFNTPLGGGALTLTLDLEAKIVWGEFTFTATGLNHEGANEPNLTVSITGSFFLRVEILE